MKVSDIMTKEVVSISEDATFHDIVSTLIEKNVTGLPVVDATGVVVGMVTEGDLLNKEAYPPRIRVERRLRDAILEWLAGLDPITEKAKAKHARDLMSSPAITIGPAATVHEAAQKMLDYMIKRVPVVENGRLVGIVAREDVLRVYTQPDPVLQATVEELLEHSLYVPPDNHITVKVSGGTALLEGTVQYESDIRIVTNLVAAVDGIADVENRLLFRSKEPSMKTLANDPRNVMTR